MRKWLGLSAIWVIADQVTKVLAEQELAMRPPVEVFSWFNLTLAYNRGAAFSFLSDAAGWQRWFFIAIAVIAVVVIVGWLRRLHPGDWLAGLSLSLILGGAIGNVIDRVQHGYVIDFIDWHYAGWHWPAFNIADVGISVGATLLIIHSLFFAGRAGDK